MLNSEEGMGRGRKGVYYLEFLVGVYHLNFHILVQFQTAKCKGYLTWNKGGGGEYIP